MMGFVSLFEEEEGPEFPLSLPIEKADICKPGTKCASTLILNLTVSKIVRNMPVV